MFSLGLENGAIVDGFYATELPIRITKPRSLRVHGVSDDIFVLERGSQSIVHLFDSDGDGIPDNKQVVAFAPDLNHGLAIYDNFIYASSDSTVYRWPLYDDDAVGNSPSYNDFPLENMEIVVNNINEDGMGGAPLGHTTRTLEFDDSGTLYISVGSNKNVDSDSYRSRIRRFNMSDSGLTFPQDFQTMEVFADGLRNEVGLAFDKHGILWGVENSADNLAREDLGGDIHQDNPAEELNRFRPEDAGKHYGYPYCWTEYNLPDPPGMGKGTVWAWPSFLASDTVTDKQCRNDFVAPVVSMQGHSAPLGITFFNWVPPEGRSSDICDGVESFPEDMDGFAFIAYHGSWNRDIPTGYKVVYVEMDENGDAVSEPIDFLAHAPPNAKWEDGFRPVDVDFDSCGRLLVTSDGTRGIGSKVVRVEYVGLNASGLLDPSNPSGASSVIQLSTRVQMMRFLGLSLMLMLLG
eukprot:jgi/Psemu1/286149/fgenesh1_pg.121_\